VTLSKLLSEAPELPHDRPIVFVCRVAAQHTGGLSGPEPGHDEWLCCKWMLAWEAATCCAVDDFTEPEGEAMNKDNPQSGLGPGASYEAAALALVVGWAWRARKATTMRHSHVPGPEYLDIMAAS